MRTTGSSISVFITLIITTLASQAGAKGLDDIQPRTETQKQEDAKTQAPAAAPAATPGSTPPANAAPATGADAAVVPPTDTPSTPAGTTAVATTVERSATSLSLDDRLSIGVAYGFVTIPKSSIGEFNAFGGADVSLQWRVYKNTEGTRSSRVSLRYLPIDAESKIKGQSYHAIVEAYYLGGIYEWLLTQSLSVFSGIELGYLQVNMESEDRFPVSESSEANKFAYGLTTGLDWFAMQKLKLGPRVNASFGDYQIVQYAGALTFLF